MYSLKVNTASHERCDLLMNLPLNYDNMTLGDAQELYMHIEKIELLKKYTFPSKPSKDGYYRIHVPDCTKKSGRRQLFAKDIESLKEKVYQYEKGNTTDSTRKTFKDVFEIVMSEKLKYIKNKEKRLSRQNTINRHRCDYKRYFAGTAFEKRFIDEITKKEIEGIVFLNLDRYDLRSKAFKSLRGLLRVVFKQAFDDYLITDNVFERVDFAKFKDMIVEEVAIEKRVHPPEEVKMILDEIHAHQAEKPNYIPAYALEMQMLCGGRRAEIPPLDMASIHETCIEFSKEQITVKKFNDVPEHDVIVNHTKTYKDRYFPRFEALNEFLDRFMTIHDTYYPDTDYLFPADNENGVISNNTVYNYYRRVCAKLNITICREQMKGTHSFRRNAITDVINASGGNIILASELFGNSPEVAKKNYYTGIDMEEAAKVLEMRRLS